MTGDAKPDRAKDALAGSRGMTIHVLSEAEFLAGERDYEDLLRRSNADPLFMSWRWAWRWWELHREKFGLSLKAHVAVDEKGRWLGVAPVTERGVSHKGLVKRVRIEPLGNLWRESGAVLTEYQSFPVDASCDRSVMAALVDSMFDSAGWGDFCIKFCPEDSATWRQVIQSATERGLYRRSHDRMYSHRLDLADGFEAFLASLSQRSRLRIYNARKRLKAAGEVRFVVADSGSLEQGFEALNGLHRLRWGVPALTGLRGEHYEETARDLLAAGDLALSFLLLDDEPIAAALNFRCGDCEYGIQSGFRGDVVKRVSPGYLHIGYMIEQACLDGMKYFDFLAGEGKESDYKRHFKAMDRPIGSLQVVRSPALAALYRGYDLLSRVRGQS